MTNLPSTAAGPSMSARNRRRVLIGLAVLVLALMIAGGIAAYVSRDDTICRDGRPPLKQRGISLGQIEYRCHDGQLVTK